MALRGDACVFQRDFKVCHRWGDVRGQACRGPANVDKRYPKRPVKAAVQANMINIRPIPLTKCGRPDNPVLPNFNRAT